MQSNYNTHLLFSDRLQSAKKEEEPAFEQAQDEPGSSFHCLRSAFSSFRQALSASLEESFYKLLVQEKSKLEAFFTTFNILKCVLSVEDEQGKHQLTAQRFVKTEILTAFGIACKLYLRNASEILKKQSKSAHDTETFFQVGSQVPKSHPMSAEIGVSVCKAVENHIERLSRLESFRKTEEEDKIQSVVWCVQIFSDKFQTFLKAGKIAFYLLHITLLNFTDQKRRHQILSGETVVAYLPVSFHMDTGHKAALKPLPKRSQRTAFL